ncbi:choice-of-anchor M domain-containing protein [Streptomyces sp. NPDC056821]|uniref:choice-of-anchor M domain-containing protein n=1 Tax=unclassified Streptomyces TaxID=2593676 RepID=UPI0036B32F7D
MRAQTRALTISGSLAAALAVVGLAVTPAVAATMLSNGHVDVLEADWDGANLSLHVHDADTNTEYAPSDVTLSVPAAAKVANPGYAFLGTGSKVWLLPEDQALANSRGVLFPGISTESLTTGVFANDRVTYTLVSATRDGADSSEFSVYAGNGNRWFDSNTKIGTYKSKAFGIATHNHATWAFEQPGTYKLTFKVSGTVGGAAKSATETYTVVVSS